MVYRFVLPGEVPAKKNNRRTLPGGRTIPSKGYMKWHSAARLRLMTQRRSQGIGRPLSSPLSVTITLTHGDLRRRDGDNGATSVLDTLMDAGIIEDDRWTVCRRVTIENRYEKGDPSCEILVSEYEKE